MKFNGFKYLSHSYNHIMKILIFIINLFSYTFAQSAPSQVEETKNIYLLEYNYIGIKLCLKDNISKFTTQENFSIKNNLILIGSKEYFNYLSECFNNLKKKCSSNKEEGKCRSYEQMKQRLSAFVLQREKERSLKSEKIYKQLPEVPLDKVSLRRFVAQPKDLKDDQS